MTHTLTAVDLSKARAYAASIDVDADCEGDGTAADWIYTLANAVERQYEELRTAHESEQAALADATRLQEENTRMRIEMTEMHGRIAALIKELQP